MASFQPVEFDTGRPSLRRAMANMALRGALAAGVLLSVSGSVWAGPPTMWLYEVFLSLWLGALTFGGMDVINHQLLIRRLAGELGGGGSLKSLIDDATRMILMVPTGQGHMFIHRRVMDHLADRSTSSNIATGRAPTGGWLGPSPSPMAQCLPTFGLAQRWIDPCRPSRYGYPRTSAPITDALPHANCDRRGTYTLASSVRDRFAPC